MQSYRMCIVVVITRHWSSPDWSLVQFSQDVCIIGAELSEQSQQCQAMAHAWHSCQQHFSQCWSRWALIWRFNEHKVKSGDRSAAVRRLQVLEPYKAKTETNVLSTKSKQIEHVQFVSTLSKGQNFVRHCCWNRQHCCQKLQQCRSNIRHCRKNRSTCSIRQCCFDIVAGMDGA